MGTYKVKPVTTLDYRLLAEKRLPRFLFDYIEGGANREDSRLANEADFRRFCLKQQLMCDVSDIDTSTALSGQLSRMPVALAPIGKAGMMARHGLDSGSSNNTSMYMRGHLQ
jgi:L-lactate dehydrogenase (cytochrome)